MRQTAVAAIINSFVPAARRSLANSPA